MSICRSSTGCGRWPSPSCCLDFGVSLSAAWLVGRAAKGFAGRFGALLTARPVMYVGTISYGLYLYHGFMPYVLGRYVTGFTSMSWPAQFALLTTATVAIAAVSWRFFESPLLKYKDRLSRVSNVRVPDFATRPSSISASRSSTR